MRCPTIAILVAGSACTLPVAAADGVVSGMGSVEIASPARILRVRVELMGRGRDIREALNKLHTRREAASRLFASLNVTPEKFAFSEPGVSTEKSQRQQEMERMLGQLRRGRGANVEAGGKAQLPVFVVSTLRADLPLAPGGAEQLLFAGHALQEKIRAADLGGVRDDEKRTPQEEELLEEMGGREMPDTGEPKRGEPFFLYVAPVAEAERDKALAEAFQRARREAARLAKAAGGSLGGVATLNASTQPDPASEDPSPGAQRFYYQYAALRRDAAGSDDSRSEAIGTQPGRVVLRVSVNAQFTLRPAEK